MKKEEDGTGCAVCMGLVIIVSLLFFLVIAISQGMFVKEPKEVIQTYEVTYVNGLKEIVSYKVHEGADAYIKSDRGSYYLFLYYDNTNLFGFKYRRVDGCVAGVVSCKRVQ